MADSLTKRESISTSAKHRDAVSPTPWRVEKSPANSNFWVVRCDTGVSLATAWREADAALIVEAVNERARLRDIVRCLADIVRHDCDERAMAVTREAYVALGEEVPE